MPFAEDAAASESLCIEWRARWMPIGLDVSVETIDADSENAKCSGIGVHSTVAELTALPPMTIFSHKLLVDAEIALDIYAGAQLNQSLAMLLVTGRVKTDNGTNIAAATYHAHRKPTLVALMTHVEQRQ
jgi:hypothetical protein